MSARGSRPVGFQQWRDLLFVHWAMPPATVRPIVPASLALDLWDARAYVTLIPFAITESRLAVLPRMLSIPFLETNLRTYVVGPDGEPGIYFWSLEASSTLAVVGARLAYGLPYFPATMAMERRSGSERPGYHYTSRRRIGRRATLDVTWSVGEPIGTATPATRDHFLVERYTLYVERRQALTRARVRHRPYPLEGAVIERLSQSLLDAAGLPRPADLHIAQFSPGVDVEIFWPEPVPGAPR